MNVLRCLRDMESNYDLVIIGAGPAGLSAAITATEAGMRALILDENPGLGGQIYRSVSTSPLKDRSILDDSYWRGRELVQLVSHVDIDYLSQAKVWAVEPTLTDEGFVLAPRRYDISISRGGASQVVVCQRVIVASGAIERPFPLPGWTLPGVMNAGAAQIAIKSAGLVPSGRTVMIGSGPLLYLLGEQLRKAGANIGAVCDITPKGNMAKAWPHLVDFLRSPYALYGAKLLARAKARLRLINQVSQPEIFGDGNVEGVRIRVKGRTQTISCDTVLLHQGVIPNINMFSAIGCQLAWNPRLRCWYPETDAWGETSIPGVAAAGDGSGIAGAMAAEVSGRIAGLAAAKATGFVEEDKFKDLAQNLQAQKARYNRGRDFIDTLYAPDPALLAPADPSTIICRCEEIRTGQIREIIRQLDVQGPNQLKAYLRTGMGPCQGRMCGSTLYEILAQERRTDPSVLGHLRFRNPVKPITLGELAASPQSTAARKAVMR